MVVEEMEVQRCGSCLLLQQQLLLLLLGHPQTGLQLLELPACLTQLHLQGAVIKTRSHILMYTHSLASSTAQAIKGTSEHDPACWQKHISLDRRFYPKRLKSRAFIHLYVKGGLGN